MKRDIELEATLVAKYAAVEPVLDERSPRRWAAAESLAIGYGGDAVVSSATGLARETIRKGRREIAREEAPTDRIRRPGGGRPRIQQDQPGITARSVRRAGSRVARRVSISQRVVDLFDDGLDTCASRSGIALRVEAIRTPPRSACSRK